MVFWVYLTMFREEEWYDCFTVRTNAMFVRRDHLLMTKVCSRAKVSATLLLKNPTLMVMQYNCYILTVSLLRDPLLMV